MTLLEEVRGLLAYLRTNDPAVTAKNVDTAVIPTIKKVELALRWSKSTIRRRRSRPDCARHLLYEVRCLLDNLRDAGPKIDSAVIRVAEVIPLIEKVERELNSAAAKRELPPDFWLSFGFISEAAILGNHDSPTHLQNVFRVLVERYPEMESLRRYLLERREDRSGSWKRVGVKK